MATNVLPVASCTAVIVTPGSTPPVESVTVPVITASCAKPMTGSARIAATTMSHFVTPDLMDSSSPPEDSCLLAVTL
jgi:hypothetical protein